MILAYLKSIMNIIVYVMMKDRTKVNADIRQYLLSYGIIPPRNKNLQIKELVYCSNRSREFLNVFYFRAGAFMRRWHISSLCRMMYAPKQTIGFGTDERTVEGGLFIQHGDSTIIHARSVGENLTIYQNVTIGDSGKGCPTIGNNVTICTGAVVLGPIHVGDNAVIGANATVVKDVSEGAVVVPQRNRIIKLNGKRVDLPM